MMPKTPRGPLSGARSGNAAPMMAPADTHGVGLPDGGGWQLRPFQRRFLAASFRPGIRTGALSTPRGNGKSSLGAWLAARSLEPADPMFITGTESHILAASIGQCRRTTFRLLRELIEARPDAADYRIAETQNAAHVIHVATNTRVSVLAANGKHGQGLVRCPLIIADEPGAYEQTGGALMADAILTAQGKPGCSLRALFVGTLAPARDGWWHEMVRDGSRGPVHVSFLAGDVKTWDRASTIQRANPLMWSFPESRKVLLDERDAARFDSRKRAAFLSYRLNIPSADESTVLLSVAEWERICSRPVPEANGARPVVGLDLGGGRSWSAAVALWPSGRVEALAVAPGTPDVGELERRDRVSAGTYRRLFDSGMVSTDGARRVPRVGAVIDRIRKWNPGVLVCDRFRLPELIDAAPPCPVVPRRLMPSEWSADIRALRRYAADGPLAVEPESRDLLAAALAVCEVRSDESGCTKLIKRSKNESRDDAAAALTLAAGALSRVPERSRGAYLGVA